MNLLILVVGVLNVVFLVWLGLRAINMTGVAVDMAQKDVRRRRLEHVAELVITIRLVTDKLLHASPAPSTLTDLQIRLHAALIGLEDELPTCRQLVGTDKGLVEIPSVSTSIEADRTANSLS